MLKDIVPFQEDFYQRLELILEYSSIIPQLSRVSSVTMLFAVFLYMTGSTNNISDDIRPLLNERADR
jgi:hypothetical protein